MQYSKFALYSDFEKSTSICQWTCWTWKCWQLFGNLRIKLTVYVLLGTNMDSVVLVMLLGLTILIANITYHTIKNQDIPITVCIIGLEERAKLYFKGKKILINVSMLVQERNMEIWFSVRVARSLLMFQQWKSEMDMAKEKLDVDKE